MSEKTLLWLLIAILVIIVVVKMCKNTNEGMRYKNNGSQLLPTFKQTMLSDNEDMRYINNGSNSYPPTFKQTTDNDLQLLQFFGNSIYDSNYVSENDSKFHLEVI